MMFARQTKFSHAAVSQKIGLARLGALWDNGSMRSASLLLCLFLLLAAPASGQTIPQTDARSLDGHVVHLPADVQRPTVLVLGFSRSSGNNLTAWDKALRGTSISFYDVAVLAAVPEFVRPWVVKSIRKEVPALAQTSFLTISQNEAEWKQSAAFENRAADAAYVLLVDRTGHVLWHTHDPLSPVTLAALHRAFSAAH